MFSDKIRQYGRKANTSIDTHQNLHRRCSSV